MQENVNAICVRDYMIERFGSDHVQVLEDGVVRVDTNSLANQDIFSVCNMLQYSDAYVKRSNKGLVVLFNPKQYVHYPMDISHYSDDESAGKAGNQRTVRDFYELDLPQEARMKAFDNTSKNKLDVQVGSLEQAILRSFYINHSPEGTEYWQDVILENSDK